MFTALGTILTVAGTLTWQVTNISDREACMERIADQTEFVASMGGTVDAECIEAYGPPLEEVTETFLTPMGTQITWADFYLISFR